MDNFSSPDYLRKQGVNRMWPTSPFMVIDLAAAMPTGMLTDMTKDTPYLSNDVQIATELAKFNASGPKLRLIIK
jgi:hypothetical protein